MRQRRRSVRPLCPGRPVHAGRRGAARRAALVETLEPRILLTATPILVVPGLGGSLPDLSNLSSIAAVQSLAGFITGSGISPTALAPETYDATYTALLANLAAKPGYTLNDNLFFAAYDWRLPTAPNVGVANGVISLSGVSMTGSAFNYTVQYLQYWIDQARTHWIADNGSAVGFHVDIIAHSLGGLVARALIQSDYYAAHDAGVVDKINLLASVNQGDASAIVVANQSVSSYFSGLGSANPTYSALITAALSISGIGNESLVTFSPSIKDLYPTYAGATSNGAAPANPLLTDLNANVAVFTGRVNEVMNSYGTNIPTQLSVNLITGAVGTTNAGDGVVPVVSANLAGLGATKAYSGLTHNQLPGNAKVEADIWAFFTAPAGAVEAQDSGAVPIVSQLFVDILQRPVDAGGLSYFVALMAGGETAGQVATALLQSPEYQQLAVNEAYQALLARDADSAGLAYGAAVLADGGTLASVQAMLAGSAEFYADAGGTDAGFAAALFEDLLHRSAGSAGVSFVTGALDAGATRTQVAAEVLVSAEYQGDLVNADYVQYLGRSADSAGLALFTGELLSGTSPTAVSAALAGSDELFALALRDYGTGDQKYLTLAYQDLLGRPIDPSGAVALARALSTGAATRASAAAGLTSSDEYVRYTVNGLFLTILNRPADPAALNYFAGEIETQGVAIDYVRAQLLASDEFLADQGGTVADFTAGLYATLLGRAPDPTGAAFVQQELATGVSRLNIAIGVVNTTEHRAFLGGTLITRYLERGYTTGDTTYYAGQLNAGVSEQGITDQIITSTEFFNLALSA